MAVRPYKKNGEIKPGKWMIDYTDAKRVRQRRVYVGTEVEAEALEADLCKQHVQGRLKNPTINAVITEYLAWMRNHRAKRTVQDIELSLTKLRPHFGPYQVNRITRGLIDDYKTKRLAAGRVTAQGVRIGDLKPRTVNKELAYLSSIISWMVEQEYCYPLSFKIKKLPSRRPLPKIPSHHDIENFIEALKDPLKQALAGLFYDCGLRWSEGAELKWESINWHTGTVVVAGKGGKERTAQLSDRCRKLLAPAWKAAGETAASGWVFPNPKTGEPYGHQKSAWETAGKKVGVRITPHLLRHAYATYTLEATGDLRAVQVELGHASVSTSEIYTHVSQARRRDVDKLRRKYLEHGAETDYISDDELEESSKGEENRCRADHGNSAQVIDITKHIKTAR